MPGLAGRLARGKVAVAGHSMGGHTASLLLGARLTDRDDGAEVKLADPRTTAGVLPAAPGRGGDALTDFTVEHYPFLLTTDEDSARVAPVARLTAAYLRGTFDPDDPAWRTAGDELAAAASPLGRIESK